MKKFNIQVQCTPPQNFDFIFEAVNKFVLKISEKLGFPMIFLNS